MWMIYFLNSDTSDSTFVFVSRKSLPGYPNNGCLINSLKTGHCDAGNALLQCGKVRERESHVVVWKEGREG